MNLAETASARAKWALLPILSIAFVAFLPALRGEFVDWDDKTLFLENENYRGLGPTQIRWMFTHATLGHYQPISWLTLGADYCLGGMNPFGYHLTSLLFHTANAALVYALALVLLRRAQGPRRSWGEPALRWAAAAAALLFAIHPLRTESVAWITERGSVVSTFFLLACVLCYLRYTQGSEHRWRWYALSLGLFFLSLLSKAWGITLPLVLLLIDVFPLRRWAARNGAGGRKAPSLLLEKLPFAIISLFTAALAYYAKSRTGMLSIEHHGWTQRLAQAAYGLCFYPRKILWPTGLCPIYELPIPFDPTTRPFIVSGLVCVVLALTLVASRRRWPSVAAAALAYAILVSPVLGLTQTGPQLVADRYSYVSCIPFALLAGGGLLALRRQGVLMRAAATTATAAIILVLVAATWTQAKIWRSSASLWTRALEIDPRSPTANGNMGAQHVKRGRMAEAIECFRAGLAVKPDDPGGMMNLAGVLAYVGEANESRSLLRRAVEMDAKGIRTLLAAAKARVILSDYADAAELYRRLVSIDPRDGRTHHALGAALAQLGRATEAAASFERAVALLEPRVQSGVGGDAERLYLDACRRLTDFFAQRRDYRQAETYQSKIEALSARE